MNKKRVFLILLSLAFIMVLSGCFGMNRIRISGYVLDQHGNYVEGIQVLSKGSTTTTNSYGKFSLSIPDVEVPTDVDITFSGNHLGFETSTRPIRVIPETDEDMGLIQLNRVKALIYGEVTYAFGVQNLDIPASLMDAQDVGLPKTKTPKEPYAAGEIIVKFKDGIQTQSIEPIKVSSNFKVIQKFPKHNIITVKTTENLEETIQELKMRPDVEYAEPNYYVYPLSVSEPTDYATPESYFDNYTWNLEAINLPHAWEIERGNYQVSVAVLDTGIKPNIMDLEPSIDWDLGWDFVDNDPDPRVWWATHGTQVASIIAATPNNGYGIDGINHQVRIIPIRILNSTQNDGAWGKTTDLLLGIEHAINSQADIINLSVAIDVSPYRDSQAVNDMIDWAEREGILIVAAAGNDSDSSPVYPASHSKVLSVGAVGPTLQPASYTNRGADIYAPGGDYSLYPMSKYNTIQTLDGWAEGTSIASAHVAGVAALMLADNPYLDAEDLRYRLKNTSLKLAYDEPRNPGLLDAYRAIKNVRYENDRIFIFTGQDFNNYQTEESTYAYTQSNKLMYQIATVPAGWQNVYAWVDRDANNQLSSGDFYAQERVLIREGEQTKIDFILKTWYPW